VRDWNAWNYHSDSRVLAGELADALDFEEATMTVGVTVYDNDGDSSTVRLPAKYEVCSTCGGKGSHVNPSIDAGGLTSEDFYEDPDFAESYFSGVYDVACHACKGRRVYPTIDTDRLNDFELAAYYVHLDALADEAAYAAEVAMERRYGC
jgi:hypothetical protein